jgi:hypothetical protein
MTLPPGVAHAARPHGQPGRNQTPADTSMARRAGASCRSGRHARFAAIRSST